MKPFGDDIGAIPPILLYTEELIAILYEGQKLSGSSVMSQTKFL